MKYLIIAICALTILSCKKAFISNKVETAYNNVMKVHDEVMPEMSTISKLKRQIKKQDGTSEASLDMMKQLGDANEGMMAWMADFDLDKTSTEKAQLNYLAEHQIKVQKVSDDMKKAMDDARQYLTTFKE